MHTTRNMLNEGNPCTHQDILCLIESPYRRITEERSLPFLFRVAILSGSMKKDAGNGPGSVRRKVGGLCQGPLVPLCAQTESVNFRREEVVQDENDRFRTAL